MSDNRITSMNPTYVLRRMAIPLEADNQTGDAETLRRIADHIEQQDKRIEELEAQNQWVSVEEILPRIEIEVLIWTGYDIHIASLSIDDKWIGSCDGRTDWIVTHWMPLPEPPTQEKSDE